jgi:hypothetical protein
MSQANTTNIVSGQDEDAAPAPLPERPTYVDALTLFREYIEAKRRNEHAVALAIEGLVMRTQEDGGPQDDRSWFVVPRETVAAFEATVAEARQEAKADKVRRALNNPETVGPDALAELFQDLVKACDGNVLAAARLLHAGY